MPITGEEFRRRFGFATMAEARAFVERRQVPVIKDGRKFWTTERALADWLVEQLPPAARPVRYDPLEHAARTLAKGMVQELLAQGALALGSKLSAA